MARLFRMGANWLPCVAWLVVCSISLADFTSVDRTLLESINNATLDIRDTWNDVTTYDRLEVQVYDHYANNKLDDILEVLQTYVDYSTLLESIDSTVANTDETVTDIKDLLDDKFDEYSDSFGALTNSINKWGASISNAISSISISGGGGVNTNFPALFNMPVWDYSAGNLQEVFYYLYGYWPVGDELDRFEALASYYGVASMIPFLLLSHLPETYLSLYDYTEGYSYADLVLESLNNMSLEYDGNYSTLGDAYYKFYGTLPLLEYFTQATNDYVLTGSNAITVDQDGRSSFSDRFVSSVGSLATSFAPSVNTNIASVSTNEIVDVEDSDYSSKYDEIIAYQPEDNGTDDILSYVNDTTLIDDFTSVLTGSGDVTFSFDLPALGSTQNIEFQVDDVTSYTGAFFEVMFGFLKFIVFSVMAYKCWSIVVDVNFQKFR